MTSDSAAVAASCFLTSDLTSGRELRLHTRVYPRLLRSPEKKTLLFLEFKHNRGDVVSHLKRTQWACLLLLNTVVLGFTLGVLWFFNVGMKEDDPPVRIKALNLVWFLQDPLYLVEHGFSGDLKSLENPTQAQGDHTDPTQNHPELQGCSMGNSTGREEAKCRLKVSQPINLQ